MTAAELVALVSARRIETGRWVAKCPAHPDRNPSLSLAEGNDGRTLVHCHAGCTLPKVLAALGLASRDLFVGPPPTTEQLREAALERERHEAGAHQRRIAHGAACDRLLRLERVAEALGGRLARLPDGEGGAMAALFCRVMEHLHAAEVAEEDLRP
jgi:hypothetical protein